MPGKLADGLTATRDATLMNSKAYCEGRQAKVYGPAINPHPPNSEAASAWAAGYALGGTGVSGPCNTFAGIVVPDVVGAASLAAVNALLTPVGLAVGTVTLTVYPVASQLPVAAAIVPPGSKVDITLTS